MATSTYEVTFSPEQLQAIRDDVERRIAAVVSSPIVAALDRYHEAIAEADRLGDAANRASDALVAANERWSEANRAKVRASEELAAAIRAQIQADAADLARMASGEG